MAFTTGVVPDLTETVAIAKKAMIPLASQRPTTGQLWPRGAKVSVT